MFVACRNSCVGLAAITLILGAVAGCKPASNDPVKSKTPTVVSTIEIRFADVTAESGVTFRFSNGREANQHTLLEWLGGGVAIIDYDGDGGMDLMFAGGGTLREKQIAGVSCGLFRNVGRWRYQEVSAVALGEVLWQYNHGCQAADFDNDGFVDVLVTGYGGLKLFHNQGDGTFIETQRHAGLDDDLWSTSAAWGDFNGDGNLDLYIAHYVDWSFANHPPCYGPQPGQLDACPPKQFNPLPDVLYFSRGDGCFYDASKEIGLRGDGNGLGVLTADFDQDSLIDAYVANDATENFLYMNRGSGRLEEVGLLAGVAGDDAGNVNASMGVDVGDYNGDGVFDLWVTNYVEEPFALYRGAGSGQFHHVSKSTGINALGGVFVGFGTAFVDLDLDGDEDIVVANGHVLEYPPTAGVQQLPLLLQNDGRGQYQRILSDAASYFGKNHLGRGLAAGDLDDDGDLDIVISDLREPVALLRNDAAMMSSWVQVRLLGRRSNRDGIGATLTLHTSRGQQLRAMSGGGSYLSQRDPRISWGVPSGRTVENIAVLWPSGNKQSVEQVPPNRVITIREPVDSNTDDSIYEDSVEACPE